MGCGVQGRCIQEYQTLQSKYDALALEKSVVYDDRLALLTEVTQMRTNVTDMLRENEILKMRIDHIMSLGNPQVFSDSQTMDELIADWREMDLRDGDVLLEALGAMHQASAEEVTSMLRISSDLRQADSSLSQYCDYFSKRFSLFNAIWQRAVTVRFDIEATFKRFKEEIAQQIQGVEGLLGKKSKAMEDLKKDFRELVELEDAKFAAKHNEVMLKIFAHRVDIFNKKLEEKDVERQRVINWYDAEISKLKATHQQELRDKDNERDRLRAHMEEVIETNRIQYEQEKQVTAETYRNERLQTADAEREKQCMLSADLESHAEQSRLNALMTAESHRRETERLVATIQSNESASTAEFAALRSAHSAALSRLAEEQKSAGELADTRMKAQSEDLLGLRMRLLEVQSMLEDKHQRAADQYELSISEMTAKHRAEVDKLTREFTAERDSLRDRIEKRVKEFQKLQVTTEFEIATVHRRAFEEKQEILSAHSQALLEKDRVIQDLKESLERETIKRIMEVRQAGESRDDQLQGLVNERKNEFMKLRRKLETENEKHELVLRKMQQQHEQFIATMMEKHREEVEHLSAAHLAETLEKDEVLRKVQSDNQVYVNEVIEKYRGDLSKVLVSSQEDLKRKEEQLAQTRAEFLLQIEQILQKHAKELVNLRASHALDLHAKDTAMQKAELEHQDALHLLMDKYREDLEKLRLHYQEELRVKDDLLAEADRKNSAMTDKFREDLAAVRLEQTEELQRRDEAAEKLKAEHRALLDDLTEKHFAELSSLRSAHSDALRQRDDSERALEASHKAAIHALMDKYRADLDRIRSQQQADLQQKDQLLSTQVAEHQQQLTALIAKHDTEVATMRKTFADEMVRKDAILAKTIESHRSEVRSLLQKSAEDSEELQRSLNEEMRAKAQEMKTLQDDYEAKLRETMEKHAAEISELKHNHNQTVEEKEANARKALAEYDVKLAEIVDKYREDLVTVREHHTWDSKRKEEMGDKIREEHAKHVAELVDRYTKEIAQLRSQYAEELKRRDEAAKAAQKSAEEKLASVITKFTAEIAANSAKHSQEVTAKNELLAKLQSDFDSRLQEVTSAHIQELQSARENHTADIQRRERVAAEMQKQHSDYVTALMDKFRDDMGKARMLHKADLDRKETLIAELQAEHAEQVQKLVEKYRKQVEELEDTHASEVKKKEVLLETVVRAGEAKLAEVEKKHQAEMDALRDAHQEALRIKMLAERQLIQSHESKLLLITQQHSSDLATLKEQHSATLSAKEEQIRESNSAHAHQVQSMLAKFIAESTSNRKQFDADLRQREETLEAQRTEYEKQLEALRLKHLDDTRSLEAQSALKVADLKREFELAEAGFASSLVQLLEEFLIRTGTARETHIDQRERQLHSMRLPNPSAVATGSLHLAVDKLERKDSQVGGTPFLQAFEELQEGLYAEKAYFELLLSKDIAVIKGLGENIEELHRHCSRLEENLSTANKKTATLEGEIAEKLHAEERMKASGERASGELLYERKVVSDLRASVASLTASLHAVETDNKSLAATIKSLEDTITSRDSVVAELQQELRESQGLTVKEQNELKSQVQRCMEDLSHRDMKIKELAETIREMEMQFDVEKRKKSLKSLLVKLIAHTSDLKRKAVLNLRNRARITSSPQPPPMSTWVVAPRRDNRTEAETIWNEELKSMLENNTLLDVLKKTGKGDKPLTLNQVLKFFEEIMDRKFEADISDIKSRRPPRQMQEFVIEHLTRTFGLRKLALKMVCQLVPALISLHREQQPEVVLFCRLLQLVNPAPIPLPLAVFLTKVRVEFAKYAKTYQLERKQPATSIATRAYLVDIFSYVYALFEDDKTCGTDLLHRLRPEEVPLEQYVLFKVCNKMAILSMNSEEVFAKMDSDGSGRMSEEEFVAGVQRTMELWIGDDDLRSVYQLLSHSDTLTRDDFITQLNFKQYLEKCKSEEFTVAKTTFLSALIEVFYAKQVRDVSYLLGEVGNRKVVEEPVHSELVRRLKPPLTDEQIEGIWRKAVENAGTELVPVSSYVRVLLRNSVLPQSVFCKCYSALEDFSFWMELSESDDFRSDSSSLKVPLRTEVAYI